MRVGFIGLGVMGFPMAGHLQRAGHSVTVYNRTPTRAQAWCRDHGGTAADTPALAAAGADLVCACVGNDDDVRTVLLGEEGALAVLAAGALLVDHTTASAGLARELHAAAAARGVGFLDAPVSGGQAGAENGALTVMVGGDPEDFSRAQPVLDVYARRIQLLGGPGAGQLAKMVNQVCIAGILQGLAEGLAFADSVGLDRAAVVEVISQGAAQSWQMDNRHATMIAADYDHGFAVDWMRKDLGMVLDEAGARGQELPLTALVDGFYADVQAMGGGRWDTSSLYARMRARAKQGKQTDST
ncbi:MAG: NAD(P)-dependent oxidoreductase [Halioglobus sp.]|nr:NAD(P)-dependent oxidoreductase [Halioglobus sp.]